MVNLISDHHGIDLMVRHAWDAKEQTDVAGMPHSTWTQQCSGFSVTSRYSLSRQLPECETPFSQYPQQLLLCRTTRSALHRQD